MHNCERILVRTTSKYRGTVVVQINFKVLVTGWRTKCFENDTIYKDRKYEYKVNATLSLSFIRDRLIKIYSQEKEAGELLEELKELFIKNVVPKREGRNNSRDVDKYRQRSKPKQFKNRKSFL